MDKGLNSSDNVFAAIKAGDEGIFTILFRKYYKKLCGFCFTYVKRYDIAEEIAADSLMSLWRKKEEINITFSLTSYLYRTARNLSLNYLDSKEGSTRILSIHTDSGDNDLVDSESLSLFDHLHHLADKSHQVDETLFHNRISSVYTAIHSLSPLRKEILELHFIKGLRARDIAERLAIPEKTVRNNIERGTRQLRQMVRVGNGGAETILLLIILQEALSLSLLSL